MTERKLVLFIAMSLDGYIAAPGDDLSFLSAVQLEGEDYGYANFINTVDTVILGRRTYDWVMKQVNEFPHADKETYIITRSPRSAIGKTQFYTGKLSELITMLKKKPGKTIFCDGGAVVVNQLLDDQLIDEFIISVIPILLGKGIRLFQEDKPEQLLTLTGSRQFASGLVQLQYSRK